MYHFLYLVLVINRVKINFGNKILQIIKIKNALLSDFLVYKILYKLYYGGEFLKS